MNKVSKAHQPKNGAAQLPSQLKSTTMHDIYEIAWEDILGAGFQVFSSPVPTTKDFNNRLL